MGQYGMDLGWKIDKDMLPDAKKLATLFISKISEYYEFKNEWDFTEQVAHAMLDKVMEHKCKVLQMEPQDFYPFKEK